MILNILRAGKINNDLNFTWNITSVTDSVIFIQLTFANAVDVSTSAVIYIYKISNY